MTRPADGAPEPLTSKAIAEYREQAVAERAGGWELVCDSHELLRARVAEMESDLAHSFAERFGVMQAQLAAAIKERDGIKRELADREAWLHLHEEAETEARAHAINEPCGDALELLWRDCILAHKPNYGPWEYPGQAYRHLRDEFNELRSALAASRRDNEKLREALDRIVATWAWKHMAALELWKDSGTEAFEDADWCEASYIKPLVEIARAALASPAGDRT